uniref:NAD-dependent protein deacetylase sirtuin-7-like isoform X1 n=1 Tax=Myxine glutinosa TaxID=7769 RepID=UPI00358E18F9
MRAQAVEKMSQGWSRSDRKEADRLMRRRKLEEKTRRQQIRQALQKAGGDRSLAEKALITAWPCLVNSEEVRSARRDAVRQKIEERVEPMEEICAKVEVLVEAVRMSKYLVVYTGAGVSTAASIPDYRGPNGVWTLLKKGQAVSAGELSDANPTITHMALAKMHSEGLVQHIVSQNCDGLHLRSGLSRSALSELHGNMYIEVCTDCGHEIVRLFDVTEKTGLRRHITGRMCPICSSQLRDTIVHFGEKGALEQPLNWAGALRAARRADTILCLGSSLKVLKKYPSLWGMERVRGKRAKLYIVNLQWTPKDGAAVLKVSARCDDIMIMLMKQLGLEIPPYNRRLGMSRLWREAHATLHSFTSRNAGCNLKATHPLQSHTSLQVFKTAVHHCLRLSPIKINDLLYPREPPPQPHGNPSFQIPIFAPVSILSTQCILSSPPPPPYSSLHPLSVCLPLSWPSALLLVLPPSLCCSFCTFVS